MYELSHTIHSFVEALNRGDSVYLSSHGRWRVERGWVQWLRSLFGLEVYSHIEFVKTFGTVLDRLEKIPINFSRFPGVTVAQPIDFHGYLNAAQAISHYVKKSDHPMLRALLNDLKVKSLGLLYRLEEENGGLHLSAPNPELAKLSTSEAEDWKKEAKIFWRAELSSGELHAIEQAVRYADFIKCVLGDEKLKDDFFSWVLRDGLPVDVYIQYPALREKITQNNLRGRIGRMGQDLLAIRKAECGQSHPCFEKIVTLPFEGKEVSILDFNKEVTFKGNYKVKIKHVFRVFRDKLKDLGNFEMFAQGILNWNSNCMGWWNKDIGAYELIDIEGPGWWRKLPVLEVLTPKETSARFGVELDGKKWILAAKSSRETACMDYDRSHAYIEMAIPTVDHTYYVIYTFGKAAIQLPRNFWHRLFLFGAYVPATIVYPDETMFFTHRQQIGYIFELTEAEGVRFMDAFKEDIRNARAGNMVFQIEAENCGKWIQNHLEEYLGNERVPNLYKFPLLEAEATGFMARFFKFFQGLPRFCRNRLFILVHYPLGAWRGRWVVDKQGQKIWKSLLNSSFWKDAITYLPTYLHKQHEIGVFADDPNRHKVWTEKAPSSQKKIEEPSSDVYPLFEEKN